MQYFFLNGRYIRDRSLQHALGEAYRGLLLTGRYPIAFFTLHMPPDLVDVNVHPTKLEVRFQDSGRLYSQLLSTLRSKFLTTDLNTRVHNSHWQSRVAPFGGEDPSGGHDAARAEQMRQELVDWAKGKVAGWNANALAEPVAPGRPGSRGTGGIIRRTRLGRAETAGTLSVGSRARGWRTAHAEQHCWTSRQ